MLVPVILLFLQAQYWHGEAGVVKPMSSTKNAKLIGGHDIAISDAPYQVSLHFKGKYKCSAVLVDVDIVLTSAECFIGISRNPAHYKIRVGSNSIHEGGWLHDVKKIVIHPRYHVLTFNIALVKTASVFSQEVTPVIIVGVIPMMEQGEEVPDGANVQVTGWGLTQEQTWPKVLQMIEVQTVNWQTCVYELDPFVITKEMMCAGVAEPDKTGFYEGDWGVPLVYNGKLAGLSNYFYRRRGVQKFFYPTQSYTKVSAFRNWIAETIQNMTSHF
ncbi:hypothetical protein ABMA28_010112 [Loxostege sticticalis]|uniref:Peptidase S1 domain-containing protein n=1 Tax=Loxostege sticticalis TaxID=481309 RepID=A0ABD0S9R2_LOXSC